MKNKIIPLLLIFTSIAVFLLSKQEKPTSTLEIEKLQADADQPKPEKKKPTSVREIMSKEAFNDETNTEMVEFDSYDVTFKMPRNYIADLYYLIQEKTFGFVFSTYYPDFMGIQKKDNPDDAWKAFVKLNHINIYTDYTPSPREEHDPNIIWLKERATKPNQKWKYELYEFTGIWKDLYYYQVPDKNEIIFISCVEGSGELEDYCSSYYKVSESLMVLYQFNKKLLPEWKKVHDGVTRLVNSFVIKK